MSESGGNGFFSELKRRNVFRVAIAFIVMAWLLLQVVDILVPMLALPEWVGRLVFLLLLIGFPVALLFAWAFELTPEGIKREKDVDRSQSITHVTGRKLDFTIIAVLVVALAVSVYANFDDDDVDIADEPVEVMATEVEPSIAVLPFTNRSANEDDRFFVDGIHDDLLTQLAKISALKVISRTSVMQYRDTEKSMKDIGDELGVSTLLEGGIQRAGNRIRINVQLIDADTDEHLWAETYNRELTADNIFEIQEEISLKIANELHAALSPDEQQRIADRPTDNLDAYEAYLLGRQRLITRNADDVAESIKYFEIAVEHDSEFADAYASLAEAYMVQNNIGTNSFGFMLAKVRPLIAKLEELGQESAMVYSVMGGLAEYEGDIELAEALYRKAIEDSPSYTTAYVWLGLLLTNFTGEFHEAARVYQSALDVDPMATLPRQNLANHLSALGLHDESLEELRRLIEIDPSISASYTFAGQTFAFGYHQFGDAFFWTQKGAAIDSSAIGVVPYLYLLLGDSESARRWRDSYVEVYQSSSWAEEQEVALLHLEGKLQEAAEFALSTLDNSRDTVSFPVILRVIRDYFLTVEREEDALEIYRDIYPELFLDEPKVNRSNLQPAVDMLLLLQRVGDESDVAVLTDPTRQILRETPVKAWYGRSLLEVEFHAILGNRDEAINALAAIVDSGWSMYVNPANPNLASIAEDPEFVRLVAVIQERVDRELSNIREMEQNGQLARTPEELPNIDFDLSL